MSFRSLKDKIFLCFSVLCIISFWDNESLNSDMQNRKRGKSLVHVSKNYHTNFMKIHIKFWYLQCLKWYVKPTCYISLILSFLHGNNGKSPSSVKTGTLPLARMFLKVPRVFEPQYSCLPVYWQQSAKVPLNSALSWSQIFIEEFWKLPKTHFNGGEWE